MIRRRTTCSPSSGAARSWLGRDCSYERHTSSATDRRYSGTYADRAAMRSATGWLINDFVNAIELPSPKSEGTVAVMRPDRWLAMKFLQRLVWHYVMSNPRLTTQQHGQRQIIRTLFEVYHKAAQERDAQLIPPAFRTQLRELDEGDTTVESLKAQTTRLAVDTVASLGDQEASLLYRRLTGVAPGSVADLLPM